MKKILIIGAGNLRNNGIYAMVRSLYAGVIERKKDVKFYMLSSRLMEDREALGLIDIEVVEDPWFRNRKKRVLFLSSVFGAILYIIINRFWSRKSNEKALNIYRECDLIVDLSGDSITTDYHYISLLLIFYRIYLGKLAGKKVILLSQTIGPFDNFILRRLAVFILNRVDLIVLRERKSEKYLRKLKIGSEKVMVTGDLAFLLDADFIQAQKVISEQKLEFLEVEGRVVIGLSPSSIIYNWFKDGIESEEKRARYIKQVSEFIDWMVTEHQCEVLLIPHVVLEYSNDLEVCKDLIFNVSNKTKVHLINGYYNAATLKAIMSKLKFLISFRMHAAIGALSMEVPAICFSYNDKFEGIIGENLGLKDFVIDIRERSIVQGIERLKVAVGTMESNYVSMKDRVKSVIKREKIKSYKNIDIVISEFD